MNSDEVAAASTEPRTLRQRIIGAFDRIHPRRHWNQHQSSASIAGPHWRRSVNCTLLKSGCSEPSPLSQRSTCDVDDVVSGFLLLPKELRDAVEEHLPRADVVCLRQTCRRLRDESKSTAVVQSLTPRQLYSIRSRLDREGFHELCELEGRDEWRSHLVCSFCLTLHDMKRFSSLQLSVSPRQRVCTASLKKYLVCGHYWTHPVVLRNALQEVLATGREQFPMHHWIQDKDDIALARAIEKNNRTSEQRTTLLVDDSGLVVQHHCHLQSRSTMLPIGWNFAAALSNPTRGILGICPHLTVHSAGIRLGIQDEVANQCTQRCPDEACRTSFGWFECPGERAGWEDLCFRVVRRFGWIEDVNDAIWRSQ